MWHAQDPHITPLPYHPIPTHCVRREHMHQRVIQMRRHTQFVGRRRLGRRKRQPGAQRLVDHKQACGLRPGTCVASAQRLDGWAVGWLGRRVV
eukprot:365119-Chlamydomonas_euryale.AAC.15